MSNSLTKQELSNTMIRPKRLYLSSEDVQDFDDSASCRYTLRESICAEEGFRLVYGLKSFGYMATANSISTRQKNNKLYFELTLKVPEYLWNSTTLTFSPNPEFGQSVVQPMEIIVPDGFYPTLTDLFVVLNNAEINFIPSGIKVDVRINTDRSLQSITAPNDVPLRLLWAETNYGYTVTPGIQTITSDNIINDYIDNGVHYQAYQVNYNPVQLTFKEHDEEYMGLYQLLFYNECARSNTPANMPSSVPLEGPNPPSSVVLFMNDPLYYQPGLTNPEDEINPNDQLTYSWGFNGGDDPLLTEYPETKTPNPTEIFNCATFGYKNLPLQIWYKPRLYPIFIEIDTSLETQNLTVDGYATNLFFRHFPLGADVGAKSFFQEWDQPVYHHMRSSRNHIDSIKIDFSSESNKWEFFNMTFFLEIVFYEVPDEEELPSFEDTPFQIPSQDAMTSSLEQYSNNFHNPFPIKSESGHRGTLRLGSSRSGELKKRRR